MSDLFPVFQGIKYIQFDPATYSFSLGQACIQCNNKIIYHESITPCSCYLYAHERCLTKQINTLNKQKKQIQMKCKVCNRYIRFDEVTSFTCGFKCKIYNLLGMICSVLGVILSVFYLDYIGFDSNQVIICLGLGFIITFCTFTATIFSINLLINKEVIIEGIRSTGLQLKISAFQNLQALPEDLEEETQTEMMYKK